MKVSGTKVEPYLVTLGEGGYGVGDLADPRCHVYVTIDLLTQDFHKHATIEGYFGKNESPTGRELPSGRTLWENLMKVSCQRVHVLLQNDELYVIFLIMGDKTAPVALCKLKGDDPFSQKLKRVMEKFWRGFSR